MAGKSSKKPVASKPAAKRKAAPRPQVSAAASAGEAARASAAPAASDHVYPITVLIDKGAEKIPVIVGSRVQHARLIQEHGEAHVKVQK